MKKFEISGDKLTNNSIYMINNVRNDRYKLLDRGLNVVREELKGDWVNLVSDVLSLDDRRLLYNASIIETSLQCMELLNNGVSLEDVYEVMDVHDNEYPCVCYGVKLTGWQNLSITNIIVKYYEKGRELEEYRNKYINNLSKKKSRSK